RSRKLGSSSASSTVASGCETAEMAETAEGLMATATMPACNAARVPTRSEALEGALALLFARRRDDSPRPGRMGETICRAQFFEPLLQPTCVMLSRASPSEEALDELTLHFEARDWFSREAFVHAARREKIFGSPSPPSRPRFFVSPSRPRPRR